MHVVPDDTNILSVLGLIEVEPRLRHWWGPRDTDQWRQL